MKVHSTLGPSSAHRWLECPGSVALYERFGARPAPNPASIYGDVVHALLEEVMVEQIDPVDLLGQTRPLPKTYEVLPECDFIDKETMQVRIDHEMLDHVEYVLKLVRRIEAELGPPDKGWYIEQKVDMSSYAPGVFGTADLIGYWPKAATIAVVDMKTGRVEVEAADNPQLRLYALGALALRPMPGVADPTIRVYIVQRASKAVFKSAVFQASELKQWASTTLVQAVQRVEEARKANRLSPYLSAGEHCRFCAVRARCPAVLLDACDWEDPGEDGLPKLSGEALAALLEKLNRAKTLLDRLKDEALRRLEKDPNSVPGWHLTRGRGSRFWRDGAEAVLQARYGEKAYRKELLSPAQIEAAFPDGKLVTAEWAVYTPGRLVVAPITENGPSAADARAESAAKLIKKAKRAKE